VGPAINLDRDFNTIVPPPNGAPISPTFTRLRTGCTAVSYWICIRPRGGLIDEPAPGPSVGGASRDGVMAAPRPRAGHSALGSGLSNLPRRNTNGS
jgi:hypothetical protein